MKHFLISGLICAILTSPVAALAQDSPNPAFRPVVLRPIDHADATLTVIDLTGAEHVYRPADLEALPTYALETVTPWREEPALFEGVMLVDLLARHGLDGIDSVLVLAENDYVSEIGRDAWETGAIMIATRVDGRAHSRRARGPIQFVVPMEMLDTRAELTAQHLVWMAALIRPVR